jgi:hypothetical protein
LLTALGTDYPYDKPINLLSILESNGLDDALWALRATEQNCDKIARLMAADFAELALPIWQKYSQAKQPELAIRAARDFAYGRISRGELAAAMVAAGAASMAAAWDSPGAAGVAAWAAGVAAWAAGSTAWAAVNAAGVAARADPQRKMREIFISYLQDGLADRDRRRGRLPRTLAGGNGKMPS